LIGLRERFENPDSTSKWQTVRSRLYNHFGEAFAIILAAYGIFDSFFDISFISTLRSKERAISSSSQQGDNEDVWGYGQILAVLIWLPVVVEYIYDVLFRGT
jgi:hypothetical protein